MYPVVGIKGACPSALRNGYGALFNSLLLEQEIGILGVLGSIFSFISNETISPFIPEWLARQLGASRL